MPSRLRPGWPTCARSYPQVKQFVVGNEPNQPAFFRPQFVRGRQVSAALFGPFLAAGYDALKSVDPTIQVIGVGLSPRGNDRPNARSNISTSPVRFLAALGRWYRRTGRQTPIMDGFSFHPYPNRATDPLTKGLSVAVGGLRQPPADQAGALGRIRRDRHNRPRSTG